MNFLFIHQNFPGQFRHIAAALSHNPEHQVVCLGDAGNLRGQVPPGSRIRILGYRCELPENRQTHHYLRDFENHVRRGQYVARAAYDLGRQGFKPDVVISHPGWGETTFLRDVFPNARHLVYCEYYYRADGGDVGFDPEFPASADDLFKIRIKNSTQLHALVASDQGVSPTLWQRSRFPNEFQGKINVIHEGIDTEMVRPNERASIEFGGRRVSSGDPVLTYVARNLEPYRGFHTFMRALPRILGEHPLADVLVVGGDDVSYGRRLPDGETYRNKYCREIGDSIDWRRVHFLGKLSYADYLKVLAVSAAHVYLTYPFVLSWSMLEAMAAGCLLIASDTAPVREVVRGGENGLLTGFSDTETLADHVINALARPGDFRPLREAARRTVIEQFDRRSLCLPRWTRWIMDQ